MRTNAQNITPFLCTYVGFFGVFFFFGLLNTKSTKLGINLDNTKFKHIFMETSHIHIDQRHM